MTALRSQENPIAIRAGVFSVLVHGVLLGLLFFSFSWKSIKPSSVAEVQLWDALPAAPSKPQPEPIKVEPKVEPKPEPKIEPKIEEKPAPEPEPKAEIQVKKEPIKPPKVEKPKEEPKPKEEVKPKEEPKPKPKKDNKEDELKKLQQALLNEDLNAEPTENESDKAAAKAAQAASQAEIDKYIGLISRKINQKVTEGPCGTGKVELTYKLAVIPTGEVTSVSLVKGSGIEACDQSVERAILSASPLPVPTEASLMRQFRNFKLKVHPNDD